MKTEDNKKKKPHRLRKNPHAAEEFQKQRHERNVARGKQVRVPAKVIDLGGFDLGMIPGHWERIKA